MRVNENTRLIGRKIVLVPYKKYHVLKYHSWMKDPELLEKTASEPLTLDEEYEMQDKWWKDADKCTFIILDKQLCEEWRVNNGHGSEKLIEDEDEACMVGDVNLFFNNNQFDNDDADGDSKGNRVEAELEVMIAESSARGKGLGKEAVILMLNFGYHHLSVQTFVVKIGDNNKESIHLFAKLGFHFTSHSECFHETTYSLHTESEDFIENVLKCSSHVEMKDYL